MLLKSAILMLTFVAYSSTESLYLQWMKLIYLILFSKAGSSKELVTKTGKTVNRRELQIFDETCPSFTLTM